MKKAEQMGKFIILSIFILLFQTIPVYAALCDKNAPSGTRQAPTCDGDSSCFSGTGIQLSILKYDGSGTPQTLGMMLVYNSQLLNEERRYYLGSSYSDKYYEVPDMIQDEQLDYDSIAGGFNCTFYDHLKEGTIYSPNGYEIPDGAGYMEYMAVLYSGSKIIIYPGSYITGLDKYYSRHLDNSIPSDSAELSSYIGGVNSGIISQYASTTQKIRDNFGVNINYSEIDDYYISAELVKRVRGNSTGGSVGSFVVSYATTKGIGEDSTTDAYDADPIPARKWEKHYVTSSLICGTQSCNCVRECISPSIFGCPNNKYKWTCQQCAKTCQNGYELDYSDYYHTQHTGQVLTAKIMGSYYNGTSSIETVRNRYSSGALSTSGLCKLKDSLSENEHCELATIPEYTDGNGNKYTNISVCKSDVNCKNFKMETQSNGSIVWKCMDTENIDTSKNSYQYYIGPSLEKALVGTSSNNYLKFAGNSCPGDLSYSVGTKHFYLQDILSCKHVCSGKSGDALLSCAENYCDAEVDFDLKGNAQKRKRACIITSCGYAYGATTDGNSANKESVNSCKNSSPYNGIVSANVRVDAKSTCGIDNLSGDDIEKTNATITSCVGDQVTDFDGDDTNDTIFDHRTYINVACKETSAFGFLDLTNVKLVAGQGIDYYAKLNGEKECTVYFNLELWKVDYASISSKDPERRKRLLYLLETYNNALNDNYQKEKSIYYGEDWKDDANVDWTSLEYKIEKASVRTKVTEIVINTVQKSPEYNLVVNNKNEESESIITEKQTAYSYVNTNYISRPVNKYVQSSVVNATYTFDKYCLTTDGKSTVYASPANGICYTRNDGTNVTSKNVYYTNINATRNAAFTDPSFNHYVETTATVSPNTGSTTNNYYNDGESCPYEIDGDGLECYIALSVDTNKILPHGDGVYSYIPREIKSGAETVDIEKSSSDVVTIPATLLGSKEVGTSYSVKSQRIYSGTLSNSNTINIALNDLTQGIEKFDIKGEIIVTKNGTNEEKTIRCNKVIHVIDEKANDMCDVKCKITPYQNTTTPNLYEIGTLKNSATPNRYDTTISTNMRWRTVQPDVLEGKYLTRVANMTESTTIYARVYGRTKSTNKACSSVCWYNLPELNNCANDYKSAEVSKVNEYCEANWDKDVSNYLSLNECKTECSNPCSGITKRNVLSEVDEYCKLYSDTLGFSKVSNCINYCYYCPECTSDYMYRTINNYNPFPNSYDSNTLGYNYPTGKRVIGSNWVGKTQYIKLDNDDDTSITGIKANQQVEYQIVLTPETIQKIRSDTEKHNEIGGDAYLDYVFMKDVDEKGKYYSKFINETFAQYFTVNYLRDGTLSK